MKTYHVLYFVSAADMGTQHPWIPTNEECTFEADRHDIDEIGTLTLWLAGEQVVTFNGNCWVYFKINSEPNVSNPSERAPEVPAGV